MAYKALYRTYRPNSFEEVAGQKHIVQTLVHAVEQNKIAHAYLFCGPRGTGKTSIAKIFAKTINCTDELHKPCLECDNCTAVQDGSHPDIIEIDAASNNGVDEVRNLIEKVKYAPLKGKYKVYIIDEVHMMSTGAFNALLKTIEEPPAHVIFILATTEPHKVLPTIISRCQRFDFTKVSKVEIIQRLHTVLEFEHISCDEEVIRIIADLADGGLRDALSILDQCIAYAQDNIQEHHINEIYGITTTKEKLAIFNHICDGKAVDLLGSIDEMIEKGIDIKRLTIDLIEILKESIMYEYTKDSSLLSVLAVEEVVNIILKTTIKKRFAMIHLLMETYDKYRSAANVGSYFEVCLLQMLDESSMNSNSTVVETSIKNIVPEKIVSSTVKAADKPTSVSRETFVKESKQIDNEYVEELDEIEEIKVETIQQEEPAREIKMNNHTKSLDDELILSLLAGATKPEKAEDMESFTKINDYLLDFGWAKFANLLKNGQIVGSGKNYIVLSVDNQAEANEINEADSKNEFNQFIQLLLHKNKKVFALSKEHQKGIIIEFKDRMIAGTLPEPVKIETVIMSHEEEKELTQEEVVLNLFGEENIVVTEE